MGKYEKRPDLSPYVGGRESMPLAVQKLRCGVPLAGLEHVGVKHRLVLCVEGPLPPSLADDPTQLAKPIAVWRWTVNE